MDSREDEQIRGITMKSSAISLHYAEGRYFEMNSKWSDAHLKIEIKLDDDEVSLMLSIVLWDFM